MAGRQSSRGLAASMGKGTRAPLGDTLGWPQSDQYRLLQPQINAEGIHVWPFDSVLPVDLRFQTSDGRNVQTNRHDYFEILILRKRNVLSGPGPSLANERRRPRYHRQHALSLH